MQSVSAIFGHDGSPRSSSFDVTRDDFHGKTSRLLFKKKTSKEAISSPGEAVLFAGIDFVSRCVLEE